MCVCVCVRGGGGGGGDPRGRRVSEKSIFGPHRAGLESSGVVCVCGGGGGDKMSEKSVLDFTGQGWRG